VLRSRVPIARLLADPATPAGLRARLELVAQARRFAVAELRLPDNDSYKSYADIGRPFVVWNVVAAPEFSVTPLRWCFPIAGCVAYRGYFKEARARDFAARLAHRGLDVSLDGVPAYSTLGRFADPVLSSMLRYGDDELVATIFHELAHQLIYVRDDSAFNEAFATAVEDAGLERWLRATGAPERIPAYRAEQARAGRLVQMLLGTCGELAQLYAAALPAPQLRTRKAAILAALAADIRAFEQREGVSFPLYDAWLAEGLNNARLAAVATYYDCVPGFQRLLEEADGELPRFYDAVRRLAQQPRAPRHAALCGASPGAEED
ncbi:MAG: aminopeptidase, partial [Gammaproteobacteria bacterium]|nr:aminopeptidase [Gammaproteobacteria bacterium]